MERINERMGQSFQSPNEKRTNVNGFSEEGGCKLKCSSPSGEQEWVMWLAWGVGGPPTAALWERGLSYQSFSFFFFKRTRNLRLVSDFLIFKY